jgi:hypothetical protein
VWSAGLLALAYASVVIQKKFWFYHHGALLPFAVVLMIWGLRRFFALQAWRVFLAAVLIAAIGFAAAPPWPENDHRTVRMNYRVHVLRAARHLMGAMTRTEFLSVFVRGSGFNYLGAERLGGIVRMHAKPDDTLWVVGFNPIAYWVSGLRCPSRFFTTHLLVDAPGGYRGGAWRAEHEGALRHRPPTFVAVPLPHVQRWADAGYRAVGELGGWVVLKRSSVTS